MKKKQNPSANLQKDGAVEVLWQEDKALTILVSTYSMDSEIQEIAKLFRKTHEKDGLTGAKKLVEKMGLSGYD